MLQKTISQSNEGLGWAVFKGMESKDGGVQLESK